MPVDSTQIKKGIQPILLKVIELGRFSKSDHPGNSVKLCGINRRKATQPVVGCTAGSLPGSSNHTETLCRRALRWLYFQPAMANILYGVNGEGAGHSTRSREIILHLQRKGHSVVAASFDRGLRNLSDVCEVLEIHGFRFTYVNNAVRYNRTLARSLFQARKATRGIKELDRVIDERGIDLVITDFEPLTSRAGRRRKLPVISIDNQHILTHFKVATPPRLPHRRHRRQDVDAADDSLRHRTTW